MITELRVGIPLTGGDGWLGGVSHMELHVKAVTTLPRSARPKLFLIITDYTLKGFRWYQPFITKFDDIIFLGTKLEEAQTTIGRSPLHCRTYEELFQIIDFYFPVSFDVLPHRCSASWIHDFQHKYLPNFFTAQDRALRDEQCQKIAQQAKLVFSSSQAVAKDFHSFYPESSANVRVLALRVFPEEEWYQDDPIQVQHKYSLPDRFILCSNQFWLHKNHLRLFQAIASLYESQLEVHLVCTGLTQDYRCPGYFEKLQQYIDKLGISHLVHILGQIPRQDQIQLLRRCLFVVQPSLFEGLSLIVQECKTLGKDIVLSNLPVHLEHQYGTYFQCTDIQDLAQKMTALVTACHPGPDKNREATAKREALEAVKHYANAFCKLVEESQVIFNKTPDIKKATVSLAQQLPIRIVTTINPASNLEFQIKATNSWLDFGFQVVSVNNEDDLPTLQSYFPNITFLPANRNRLLHPPVPYPLFDDLLIALASQQPHLCGIVRSDIFLNHQNLYALLQKESKDALLYGSRVEIDTIDTHHTNNLPTFDYFFFDKKILSLYPQEEFCLNLPWCDLWAILIPLAHKIPLKQITTPIAFHAAHSIPDFLPNYIPLAQILAKYFLPRFPLDKDTVDQYYGLLLKMIQQSSQSIALP